MSTPKRKPRPSGAVLDDVEAALRMYVILPNENAYVTVVLWIAATHGIRSWEYAPRLCVISPEKRCGKTRLLDVIEHLCHKPMATVNASVAAVTRSLDMKAPPTLLVDEADSIFGTKRAAENHEDLRGILNAGHQRGKYVMRWDVTTHSLEKLSSFAMVALASIKDLPDTIMDRGPVIRMRRRANGEAVAPFRGRRDGTYVLLPLAKRLSTWVAAQKFPDEVPGMPVEDRAADNWEPLIAVADAAGGDWPERARLAAKVMTETEAGVAQESFGLELLRDIEKVWPTKAKATHTTDLLSALHGLDESPWGNYHGSPLTAHELGRLLKPYGVKSFDVKLAGTNKKGYRLVGRPDPKSKVLEGGLADAWKRYLPDAEGSGGVADE
ncbi:DUF3631 domain-containing protein [Nocardioides sp. cx-173]|uniref:DUF3631 domain-containing protein n=1 Tax=Nocardioides sp. cx-173 TaxID=2898796 RepID=UPI001E649540|nr:DUF3631 domain-containing protein [Nocardioides sp. cx-173]MCD4527453.1 DUF3631 domain-containing protein [Nocardioides sp. cx-173]UGB40407.1 DUF3631 domain-containing protein [Nocardioides sp. cx-173]